MKKTKTKMIKTSSSGKYQKNVYRKTGKNSNKKNRKITLRKENAEHYVHTICGSRK